MLAGLTDWQVRHLYFAPRDDKGRLIPPPDLAADSAAAEAEAPGGWLDSEAAFVAAMLGQFGNTPDHWKGQWALLEEKRRGA